ncbi:MAG: S41 family peptidase [Ignavibacteria bacterium]|nr:S41 family peptidase [Ignavibacteria bacterium]
MMKTVFSEPVYVIENKAIDRKFKEQTVSKISKLLWDNYIFPETSKKMEDHIKSRLVSGAYDSINDIYKFSEILTDDLQSISHDKHIRVMFDTEQANMLLNREKNGPAADEEQNFINELKKENYGFKKVEILEGNIGYIDFRHFAPPEYAKETIASVIEFVSNTDALIFDLRNNGGGDPACVQLICSYLFGEEPVHFNDLYFRPADETREFWNLKKVDGKKMPNVPVYVLTSKYTFSGAEEFSYNLKNLKRGTIIGETTGGGAHPGGVMPVNTSLIIFVPTGRAISPVTKTNWEGVGVVPDYPVKSELALEQAKLLALQKLTENTSDPESKSKFEWMITSLKAVINPVTVDEIILKNYAGTYDKRTITFENGILYYTGRSKVKYQLIPIDESTFALKDLSAFRVKFVKDASGNITELMGIYDDGHTDKSVRSN